MVKIKHVKDEKGKVVDQYSNPHSVSMYGTLCVALCCMNNAKQNVRAENFTGSEKGGRLGVNRVKRAANENSRI